MLNQAIREALTEHTELFIAWWENPTKIYYLYKDFDGYTLLTWEDDAAEQVLCRESKLDKCITLLAQLGYNGEFEIDGVL